MNVLFWISPLTEMDWPFQKSGWLCYFVPDTIAELRKIDESLNIVSCVSLDLYRHFELLGGRLPGRVVTYSQRDLTNNFTFDTLKERKTYQRTGRVSPFYEHLDKLFLQEVGDSFSPDVIVSFNESPFLRLRFPQAVHLTMELSVFSRTPYPMLFAFDPISDGNGARFVSSRAAGTINAQMATLKERESLTTFRTEIRRALRSNVTITRYFDELHKRYHHVVLMPLGYDGYFDTLINLPITRQFELVEAALSHIGEDTCIVLTQHPFVPAILASRISELQELYANLVYENWFASIPNFSQVALEYCDACLVGGSSVAYQAAFLGKYLISPDSFCAGIADTTSLEEIEDVYHKPPMDRDNYFVWILRHYAVEMNEAGDFFRKAFPIFRSWRSHDCEFESRILEWPEICGGDEFAEKLNRWVTQVVVPYGEALMRVEPTDVSETGTIKRLQGQLATRDAQLATRDAQLATRDAQLATRDAQLGEVLNSRSWRITKPLRFVGKVVRFLKNPSGYQFPECDDDSLVERCRLSVKVGGLLSRDAIRSVYLMSGRSTLGVSKYMVYAFHQLRENARQYNSVRNDCRRKALACTSSSHTHRLMSAVIKPIALYLPQYHRIPENDKWWGEGFTEWTNVKKAKPLFKGHYQPHVPHKDIGYYDLSDVNVMRKQAAMAKKYGIYGFCFYYYHFANGKRLLEKPINNYLAAKDIDFPFCFCWANENWTRRWDGGENDVIMPQDYGRENMMNMFRDMLVAFKDPRYIKVGDHKDVPVLLIYRPEIIPDIKAVILEWRRVAKASGFKDLYLIGCQNFKVMDFRELGLDASYSFYVPCTTADSHRVDGHELCISSYDSMMDATWRDENVAYPRYRIVTPSWDNSPRRGVNGAIMVRSTPKKFKQHFEDVCYQTLADDKTRENGFVFINAWNEWAEGAHLEPDEKNGYAYLKAVSKVMKERAL